MRGVKERKKWSCWFIRKSSLKSPLPSPLFPCPRRALLSCSISNLGGGKCGNSRFGRERERESLCQCFDNFFFCLGVFFLLFHPHFFAYKDGFSASNRPCANWKEESRYSKGKIQVSFFSLSFSLSLSLSASSLSSTDRVETKSFRSVKIRDEATRRGKDKEGESTFLTTRKVSFFFLSKMPNLLLP